MKLTNKGKQTITAVATGFSLCLVSLASNSIASAETNTDHTRNTNSASTPYNGSYPPYWHKVAPKSCPEDSVCWIGSKADGRTDRQSLNDWQYQIRHAPALNYNGWRNR